MKKMKIMIMTDMEGVTGVHDYKKCCTADGCYYQTCRRLLTQEVNAAIAGFFAGGATEIVVATGHGYDSLDRELLDERVEMLTGHFQPIWPWGLDESFDALAFVGQHAKAGSDYAHLAHTGSFAVLDFRVNGISIGEYGGFSFCAMELGIPVIFAAGDRALTLEAQALTPGVFTVAGKHGLISDGGQSAAQTAEEYQNRNLASSQRSPQSVRAELTRTARAAAEQWHRDKTVFHYPDLHPPDRMAWVHRRTESAGPEALYVEDPASYIACKNRLHDPELQFMPVEKLPEGV